MKKILMICIIMLIGLFNINYVYAYDEEYENQNRIYSKQEEMKIQEKIYQKMNRKSQPFSDETTVVIDPGHGGKDSGAVSKDKKFKEKDLNLDISLAVKEFLNRKGINVIMTRDNDEWLELKERSMLSNSTKSILFVSIHNDTSEGNGDGAHAIYSLKDKNGGTSKDLANNILNSIDNNTSQNKSVRGAWTREGDDGKDWYHVIREVNVPSAIIECSFMNKNDIKAVDTLAKRNTMGEAIGLGILKTIEKSDSNLGGTNIEYRGHVEGIGWQNVKTNGQLAGTIEQYKRLEGLEIKMKNAPVGASIKYRGHVEGIGWMPWVKNGELVGTVEQSKRLEAVEIKLEGMEGYHVEYRVHVEGIGWMPWVRDGKLAGTVEQYKRIEGIEIRLIKDKFSDNDENSEINNSNIGVDYIGHVEGIGWMPWVRDGKMVGTVEQSKRLEGVKLKLRNMPVGSDILYRGHVEGIGWMPWVKNGELVGTVEQSKRLEAIEIKLSGTPGYHVEYRTHVEGIGWMPWVRDGAISGTVEQYKRIEAIEIRIVK